MAFSKASLYSQNDQITCNLIRALGHPARLEIIRQLGRDGTCTLKGLSQLHPISQETMSHHLERLRKAYLVSCIEKFPHTYYSLEKENLKTAKQKILEFLQSID